MTDCANLKCSVEVRDSSKGVTYEIRVDVADVFVRDVCHFVNEGYKVEYSRVIVKA